MVSFKSGLQYKTNLFCPGKLFEWFLGGCCGGFRGEMDLPVEKWDLFFSEYEFRGKLFSKLFNDLRFFVPEGLFSIFIK